MEDVTVYSSVPKFSSENHFTFVIHSALYTVEFFFPELIESILHGALNILISFDIQRNFLFYNIRINPRLKYRHV